MDVFAYNSKVYYIIFDGGGYGQQVFRMPITGNETVLDAIGKVQGLASGVLDAENLAGPAHARQSWLSLRPAGRLARDHAGRGHGHQLRDFPGDRIYVKANCMIAANNYLYQFLAPINQIMSSIFLGTYTAQSLTGQANGTVFSDGRLADSSVRVRGILRTRTDPSAT